MARTDGLTGTAARLRPLERIEFEEAYYLSQRVDAHVLVLVQESLYEHRLDS